MKKDYKNQVTNFRQINFRLPDEIIERMKNTFERIKRESGQPDLSYNKLAIGFLNHFLDEIGQ